jgi:hypothetical protein
VIVRAHAQPLGRSRAIAGMCGLASDRSCERAVRRAWRDLCGLGTNEISAFHACTTRYRIRHPAASLHEARDLVAEWLDQDAHGS